MPGAALGLCQLKIEQFSPDILKFSTKNEENPFKLFYGFLALVCLYFMQVRVDWVLIIFGTQVIKKRWPVRPVFPDYLSVSYDYVQNNQPVTELSISVSPITKHQIFCTKLRKYSPTSYNT